jgi:hypothetical protein
VEGNFMTNPQLLRDQEVTSDSSYVERNRRWLLPLFVGFVLLAAQAFGRLVVITSDGHDPLSLSITGWFVALALILAGLGAWMTDTASARVVAGVVTSAAMVVGAFGLVVVFWSILEIIAS